MKVSEQFLRTADHIEKHGLYQGGAAIDPDDGNRRCTIGAYSAAVGHLGMGPFYDAFGEFFGHDDISDWSDNAPSADWVVQELRFAGKWFEGEGR